MGLQWEDVTMKDFRKKPTGEPGAKTLCTERRSNPGSLPGLDIGKSPRLRGRDESWEHGSAWNHRVGGKIVSLPVGMLRACRGGGDSAIVPPRDQATPRVSVLSSSRASAVLTPQLAEDED